MIKSLHISESLSLPRDTVTSTVVVYGGKGMGKTNLAAVIVEELAKLKLRWSVLDPVGVWWGMRHAEDGKGPGVECLILGGGHGDIPIEPTGGAVVADLVADEPVNVIIDFSRKSNGESWGVGEKIRFVTDYGKRLFQRQSSLVEGRRREPLFQMIDEAARFIPQMIRSGQPDLAMCLSVWSQIVEEGRNAGLGVGLVTQRSARLNKDVAELADAMIAFRTVGPNSVDAVMDWLGEHVPKEHIKDIIGQLRSLPVGSGLVVSPGWLEVEEIVHFRKRETFDSSATPKPGESVKKVTGAAAKPDLAKYAARMRETIARQKDNDPKELKARISQLERGAATGVKDIKTVQVVDQRAVANAIKSRDQQWRVAINSFQRALNSCYAEVTQAIGKAFKDVQFTAPAEYEAGGLSIPLIPARTNAAAAPVSPKRRIPPSTNNASGIHLPPGERAVLVAAAQYTDGVERDQLSVLTGYKRSSRDAYIQRLGDKSYVERRGDRLYITEAGIAALGRDYEPLPTGMELQRYWIARLPEGERRVLEILIGAGGKAVLREVIDESTGYKRSSRDAYIQRLSSRRLVDNIGRGEVKAADTLFD